MTVQITQIEIRNFRSARNLSIAPDRFAVLVGKNDSGKSNVLRALNLFFNDETDTGEELNFDIDHNIFNQPNRRAKQISITLHIALPHTYHDTNGEYIVWEKRWRADGLVHDEYYGGRDEQGRRGAIKTEWVEIPDKSNVHGLLRNINFVYVPAIKDFEYFSQLRASIYDVIAEIADQEFRDKSEGFERAISLQLNDLTSEIAKSLGFQSRLALPRDLSHIFESLDFLSEDQSISLSSRGDGIKARHIPLILKFMADKKRSLQVQGAPPHSFIWGYEEPENNLEFASCVQLADQFLGFIAGGVSQVFLTTHSPVFYNLRDRHADENDPISSHHIFCESADEGTRESSEATDLDDRMGTTAVFARFAREFEERVREREAARAEAERLAEADKRKLFVEGPSDRDVIGKALKVFAPDHADQVDIETAENGAGHGYVIDRLMGWAAVAKHTPDTPRAAGLVDRDSDARAAANEWNGGPRNTQFAKCMRLRAPEHLYPVLDAGFEVPVVLETLYDRRAWEWAEQKGYLADRPLLKSVPDELANRLLNQETTLSDNLHADWEIYVRRQFKQEGKRPVARYFARRPDEEFRERLPCLQEVVEEIVTYLFPEDR